MGIVSERGQESIGWRDDEDARCGARVHLRRTGSVGKRGNERKRTLGSREPVQRDERMLGAGRRHQHKTEE